MLDKPQVVTETDILCPQCQVPLQVLQPFGEVEKGLRCPRCYGYVYWIGGIYCCLRLGFLWGVPEEQLARMRELVGGQVLRPWAEEHIKTGRARLGLPPEEDEE